jgi:hypothetical protein
MTSIQAAITILPAREALSAEPRLSRAGDLICGSRLCRGAAPTDVHRAVMARPLAPGGGDERASGHRLGPTSTPCTTAGWAHRVALPPDSPAKTRNSKKSPALRQRPVRVTAPPGGWDAPGRGHLGLRSASGQITGDIRWPPDTDQPALRAPRPPVVDAGPDPSPSVSRRPRPKVATMTTGGHQVGRPAPPLRPSPLS